MNTRPISPAQSRQRKIHYIDQDVQKWLLVSLVVLEVMILSVAGAILYARLNFVAEESLYRIHFTSGPSMFSVLLKESVPILAGMVVANLLALFVANRIWARYVNGIVAALRDLLSRSRDLDLQADPLVPMQHPVLDHALAWRSAERARHLALREALETLEKAAANTALSNSEFRACLLALRGHLPARDQ